MEEMAERTDRERRGLVRRLARRFAAGSKDSRSKDFRTDRDVIMSHCTGGRLEGPCRAPTRAHVLSLRRYWEGVIARSSMV